ncbi:MAG: cadherin-like beta sandwich domain-containing protein [Lachnospiraceae bacterium]
MKKKIAILLAFVMVVGLLLVGINKKAYAREAQMYIAVPEEIKKEQEIKVKVVLDSDVDLYSVDAYIDYDDELLEFVPENDVITGADGVLEIKDVFGEETKQKEYEITFRTLDVGDAYVNLTEVYLIDYADLDYITVTPSDYSFHISVNETVAEDARLSDLLVAPGDLLTAFDPNVLEYEMHVGMDVDTVGVSAFAANEDSVVDLEMPDTIVEGENVIKITVTALSGNVNIYTIRVIKAQWPEETETVTEEPQTEEVTVDTPVTEITTEEITDEVTVEENTLPEADTEVSGAQPIE